MNLNSIRAKHATRETNEKQIQSEVENSVS